MTLIFKCITDSLAVGIMGWAGCNPVASEMIFLRFFYSPSRALVVENPAEFCDKLYEDEPIWEVTFDGIRSL